MISMQKLIKLEDIPQENLTISADGKEEITPPNWPSEGRIELNEVSMRYKPRTPLRLTKLSLEI